MRRLAIPLTAAIVALAVPASLSAHRMWLLPSGTVFSGADSWVTVDSAVSNDLFYADHQPGRLEQLTVVRPDGSPGRLQNGSTGRYRSTFDVQLDRPGTWRIGSSFNGYMGSFVIDGVEKRVGRRGPPQPGAPAPLGLDDIPSGAQSVKVTEFFSRNDIFVTAGAPTTEVFKPTNKGLEFVPITHPDELVSGETARFRFIVDGKPAAGLKVTLVPGGKRYRDAEGASEIVADGEGVVSIKWPSAGMFWLSASRSDTGTSDRRASERRMTYSATLEVMTP